MKSSLSILLTVASLFLMFSQVAFAANAMPFIELVIDGEEQDIPSYIKMDAVAPGGTSVKDIEVKNFGQDTVILSRVPVVNVGDYENFNITSFSDITLDPGESTNLTISFNPDKEGYFLAGILIRSDGGAIQFSVEGRGGAECKKSSQSGLATISSTKMSEDWRDPSAWDLPRTPLEDDNVEIDEKIKAEFQIIVEDLIITNCGELYFTDNYADLFDEEYTINGNIYNDGKLRATSFDVYGDIINNGELFVASDIDVMGGGSRFIGGSVPIKAKFSFNEEITLTNSPVFLEDLHTSHLLTIAPGNIATFYGDVGAFGTIKSDKIYLSGYDKKIDNSSGRYGDKSWYEGEVHINNNALITQNYGINIEGDLIVEEGSTLNGDGYSMNVNGDIINYGVINDSCLKPTGVIKNYGTINAECEETLSKLEESADLVEEEITSENSIFNDVSDHWAASYIIDLYEKGIVQGRSETTFEPEATINRAEILKITVSALGLEINENLEESSFSDVDVNAWYAPYVEAAFEDGIVEGYMQDGERLFKPNDDVIRVDALKVFLFANGKKDFSLNDTENVFTDIPSDVWYSGLVSYAKENNIVGGYPDGSFSPTQTVTRAEAVKMLSEIFFGSI